MSSSVYFEWVMARYTGDMAKYVTGLANMGIGYYVLERPDKGTAWVVVAFKRGVDHLEPHLTQIKDDRLIAKIERVMSPMDEKGGT